MKILLLAPQPFYTERGTPIAVRCLLAELSRLGATVDVLTFHEGADVEIPNVRIVRIPRVPGTSGIGPGFSVKKLACDVVLFFMALKLAVRGRYRYVHAVEEAAFMAAIVRVLFRLPFVYDMDSSMAEQLIEQHPRLVWLRPLLKRLEAGVVRRAAVVIPVCESLARIAREAGAARTIVLTDPPAFAAAPGPEAVLAREQFGLTGTCFMYAGNLEAYQGVALLLDGFAMAVRRGKDVGLVIVGGRPADVDAYRGMAERLGVSARTRFLGPRPVAEMGSLVAAADVLVSPRIKGVNTPMKIYAYLNSGKPILATDIEAHSQVLDGSVAVLEPPVADRFAEAICRLAGDARLREELAGRATALAREKYSQEAFAATVRRFTDLIESLTAA
jgi:glycosyltransferase involved in cell wall biosynthesis